jgi:pectate lyase
VKKIKTVSLFLFIIFLSALDNGVNAALPSNELWREDLTNNVVGFGENTTGGKGGTLCQVTNLNNSGPGSLRACAEAAGAMWITFTVSGTINLSSAIYVKSDKTIDGRGQNIVIASNGFILGRWHKVGNTTNNVIIHNLAIKDTVANGGIMITEDASNIWVDHVSFENRVDEAFYIGSDGGDGYSGAPPHSITLSWNRCITGTGSDKCILVSDPTLPQDVAITATFHHNWYDRTYVRHPLMRYAKIHAFNNYYYQTDIGAQVRTGGQFYSENEIFYRIGSYPMVSWQHDNCSTCEPGDGASVKVVDPWLINGAVVNQVNTGAIFNPASFYAYTADSANAALQSAIVNGAGPQNVITSQAPQAPSNLLVQ